MEIIFATNNEHKIREIASLISDRFKILSLSDVNISGDIPEESDTLEGNALGKARFVHKRTGMAVFADDTGLEVHSLGNRPGVHSARYAGEERDSGKNIEKLLSEMKNIDDRRARFRTCIALIAGEKEFLFEGVVDGIIIKEKRGKEGFGYDPVFVADGMSRTFAEISLDEKNSVSHRARAFEKLVRFLKEQGDNNLS
ncbi:MAG: RdgB/HAM1 family non-canonical purine NTP pyrophosphatase [Bacteroidales bacterium]